MLRLMRATYSVEQESRYASCQVLRDHIRDENKQLSRDAGGDADQRQSSRSEAASRLATASAIFGTKAGCSTALAREICHKGRLRLGVMCRLAEGSITE